MFNFLNNETCWSHQSTGGFPVTRNGCVGVFHFDVLVCHNCPGIRVIGIELQRSLWIQYGLLVLTSQSIVVSCNETMAKITYGQFTT